MRLFAVSYYIIAKYNSASSGAEIGERHSFVKIDKICRPIAYISVLSFLRLQESIRTVCICHPTKISRHNYPRWQLPSDSVECIPGSGDQSTEVHHYHSHSQWPKSVHLAPHGSTQHLHLGHWKQDLCLHNSIFHLQCCRKHPHFYRCFRGVVQWCSSVVKVGDWPNTIASRNFPDHR